MPLARLVRSGLLIVSIVLSSPVWAEEEAGDISRSLDRIPEGVHLTEDQRRFVREQLETTLKLYDEHFRVPETGQYLDLLRIDAEHQERRISSIAATGIGLISLAIGDKLGTVADAEKKAAFTLRNLLNDDPTAGFYTERSKSGWYHHFINGDTGAAEFVSKYTYSTIDTALLAAGAAMVGNHFAGKAMDTGQTDMPEVVDLAWKLVFSVRWNTAIRETFRPSINQVFYGRNEKLEDRFWSLLYDEYVLLPCIGRSVEGMSRAPDVAHRFWDKYLTDVRNLPQLFFSGKTVLATGGNNFVSHFTLQFGYYMCRDLLTNPTYGKELAEAMEADRDWFRWRGGGKYADRWWGLGAGAELMWNHETGEPTGERYAANSLGDNPNHTFSPSIMGGFLPIEQRYVPNRPEGSQIVSELMEMYRRDECLYDHRGLKVLWRCGALDPSKRVVNLQGIDLSTYMFGLAAVDRGVGLDFFRDTAPGIGGAMERSMSLLDGRDKASLSQKDEVKTADKNQNTLR